MYSQGRRGGKNRRRFLFWTIILATLAILGGWYWMGSSTQTEAARDLWISGDYESAVKMFERVMDGSPENADPHYMAALCHRGLKNWERAISYLLSLRDYPDYRSRAFYQQVLTNIDAQRLEQARKVLREVDTNFARSPLAHEAKGLYHIARTTGGLDQIHQKISEIIGDTSARSYDGVSLRIVYAATGVYDRSLDSLFQRLQDRHDYGDTVALRLIFDRAHQDLITGFDAFERSIRLSETNSDEAPPLTSRLQLSNIYRIRGRTGESQQQLRAILDARKSSMGGDTYFEQELITLTYQARNRLAQSLMDQRKHREALAELRLAEDELEVENFEVERLIAECYAEIGKHDLMVQIATKWLKRDPDIAQLNFVMGRYHLERKEYTRAITFLERAQSRRQRDRQYNTHLARCYMALKRHLSADRVLETLIQAEPNVWEHYVLRAEAMEGLGWREEMRTFLVRALRLRFADPATVGHIRLRQYLGEFAARNDLLPKDLYTAATQHRDDPGDHVVARRYLELLERAGDYRTGGGILTHLTANCAPDDPEYFNVMLSCGSFEYSHKSWEKAADYFQRAARTRPYDPQAFIGICRSEIKRGMVGHAWKALEKARLFSPDSLEVRELNFRLLLLDEDHANAAQMGMKLLEDFPEDIRILHDVAEAFIKAGQLQGANPILDRLRNLSNRTTSQTITLAEQLLSVKRVEEAEKLMVDVVRVDLEDAVTAKRIADILFSNGRYNATIDVLRPVTEAHPDGNLDALKTIAAAQKMLGNTGDMIETVSTVYKLGARTWAYTQMVRFCLEHAAYDEALSVIDGAIESQNLTANLLHVAIQTAIDARMPAKARRYLQILIRRGDADPMSIGMDEIRVNLASKRLDAALSGIDKLLKTADARQSRALRLLQIDSLGEAGRLEDMGREAFEAMQTLADHGGLATRASHYLVVANNPDAMKWIEQAFKQDGPSEALLFDRGILHFEAGEYEEARISFAEVWKIRKDAATAHAVALTAAALRNRNAANLVLRKSRANTWSTWEKTSPVVDILMSLPSRSALAMIDRLPGRSESERGALKSLVQAAMADREKSELARQHIATYLLLEAFPQAADKAVAAINGLSALSSGQERAIKLLAARVLLRSESGFQKGIRATTALLQESDLGDEAALLIYAETYAANRDSMSLLQLIEYLLKAPATFSQGFFRDLAAILSREDYHLQAARILFSSPENSVEKDAILASALYNAGHVDRAARLLMNHGTQLTKHASYAPIVGHYLAQDPLTARQGFRLVRDAVYDTGADDPTAYLALAYAAFAVHDNIEGTKNIRKYIAAMPASGRAILKAVKVVGTFPDSNVDLLVWLESRRALLDPSLRITIRNN